jgi:hypothetical protein
VPYTFFAKKPAREEPKQPVERPEDPLKKRWEELQDRISKLHEARGALSDLFVAKLQQFEQMQPAKKLVEPTESEKKGVSLATSAGTDVDMLQEEPWTITAEDLKAYTEPFRAARAAGILPELATLPEVINHLDTEIASLTAQAAALGERKELMLVGRSFVHVRRAHPFKYDVEGRQ